MTPGQIVGKWTPKNYLMFHSSGVAQVREFSISPTQPGEFSFQPRIFGEFSLVWNIWLFGAVYPQTGMACTISCEHEAPLWTKPNWLEPDQNRHLNVSQEFSSTLLPFVLLWNAGLGGASSSATILPPRSGHRAVPRLFQISTPHGGAAGVVFLVR